MKKVLVFLIALWAVPCCAISAEIDPSVMVAEWDGGGISVGDYIEWWERIPENGRPPLSTIEEKTEFLESMINARLMLAEAESLGLDKHPDIIAWVKKRGAGMMEEELFAQATAGRLGIDEEDVERFYERRLTQIVASHIIVPTLDKAEALLDSIEAGVPFEDLASRHSTCASSARGGSLGAVRWGDFSDRWSEQAFRLEPGEVSPPFEVETGYGIIKVEARTLMEPENPAAERQRIRARLAKQQNFEERKVFTDSLRLAYEVEFDVDAVVDLCAKYALALMEMGETREVVDTDIIPDLTDTEKAKPIVTYRGGSFTYGKVVDMILSQPYPVRPTLDDPGQMIPFVSRQITDTLVIMEAERRGLADLPKIAIPLEKIRQKKTAEFLFRYVTQGAEVPEDAARAHFETHREAYRLEPGHTASKILVGSRVLADSLLELINAGESFEEIARERSIDPFSAPQGGDLGFIALGKDPEYDEFFATMQVGEIKYFRSLEGHLIMWLRDKQENKLPTFEEARESVTKSLLPSYKDQMLREWVAEKRERRGVTINASVLEQIDLGA